MAFVVLPLVCGDDEREDQCAARARDFMRILAHVDTRFALALRRRGVGYVDVFIADDDGADRDDGAEAEERDDGAELLRMDIFDSMGRAVRGLWETNLTALGQYRTENDGNYPPRTGPFAWLANWIHTQRAEHRAMSDEHRGALNTIGFCWSPRDEKWERMRFKVAMHCATHGTMPAQRTEIGSWANTQLRRKRNGRLEADRIARLEAIPGWQWSPVDAEWDRNYERLRALGALPPSRLPLGRWVQNQRDSRATMSADSILKLEALVFWTWDPLGDAWRARYAEIRALGRMPAVSSPQYIWARHQRRSRATLSVEYIEQLQALSFWSW